MSIFTRFKDIVNSNINSLLDKAEDPEKMLRLMINEMEETVIELKSSTSARMAEAIRLNEKVTEAEKKVARWQERAEIAIEKGKDDLAREALIEKRVASEELERVKLAMDGTKSAVEEGKKEISTLEEKVKIAKDKLENLQRENQRAQERSKETVNLNARFEDLENKINRMNAYTELSRQQHEESAEEKFKKMERNQEIEEELAKIKKEKGL